MWAVQQKFFHSFFVFVRLGDLRVPVYPGGYLIGGLLLLNLVSAHAYRFKAGWSKSGIWMAHAGLILLLVGELVSGLVQEDYQMRLDEGETKNYSESPRLNELAIIDETDPSFDDVVAIPESVLARGTVLQVPKLPFRVVPRDYYPNSALQMRSQAPGAPPSLANMGHRAADRRGAARGHVQGGRAQRADGVRGARRDPTARSAMWAVSPLLGMPQRFQCGGPVLEDGHEADEALRSPTRSRSRSSATTSTPGRTSRRTSRAGSGSTPRTTPGREVLIYMNNPLRYAGLTYYQAGYDGEHTTILQVVRNPSWLVPYIACGAIALGLVVQFLIHLVGFAGKRRRA